MQVDILYITHDRLDCTRRSLLDLIDKSDYPFRLQIVDNASTDETKAYLMEAVRRYSGRLRIDLILNPCNVALSRVTNSFWRNSSADLVGKIDNDIVVEECWLSKFVEAHKRLEQLAVIGGCHFPEKLLRSKKIARNLDEHNGIGLIRQPYIGGNYLAKRPILMEHGFLPEDIEPRSFRLGGWTGYQERLAEKGFLIGYYYPIVRFEHLHTAADAYYRKVRNISRKKYMRWEYKDAKRLLFTAWNWHCRPDFP